MFETLVDLIQHRNSFGRLPGRLQDNEIKKIILEFDGEMEEAAVIPTRLTKEEQDEIREWCRPLHPILKGQVQTDLGSIPPGDPAPHLSDADLLRLMLKERPSVYPDPNPPLD